jgi:hypothetical protein
MGRVLLGLTAIPARAGTRRPAPAAGILEAELA